jgi:hypothetical protein
MTAAFHELERLTLVAPFGVQFHDPLSASLVREGLDVALHPVAQPRRRVSARPNAGGVYVLQEGEARDYRCEVSDLGSRFLPLSFSVRLPFRGLFTPACGSPPAQQGIALYSAPTRPVAGGYAVLRAELADAASGRPAAWAMVAAEYRGSELGRGLADREGRLLLAFAYPEPERRPRRSPPEPPEEGALMRWEVGLRAFYDRGLAAQAFPDYCALLSQPAARLLEGSPPQPLEAASIVLGRELVLPRLLIEPA